MKKNLLIDLAPPQGRANNLIKYRARLFLSKICFRIYRLAKDRQEILESINNLHRDIQNKNLHRSGYTDHYSEAAEISVLNRYKKEFSSHTAKNRSGSAKLNSAISGNSGHNAGPRTVWQ
jgi:hypothetical protein